MYYTLVVFFIVVVADVALLSYFVHPSLRQKGMKKSSSYLTSLLNPVADESYLGQVVVNLLRFH